MTPKKIYVLTRDIEILDAETQLTRAWVNLNPHKDRTEYTDLSQVWHDASEIPRDDSLIILQSTYGDILLRRFENRKSSMVSIRKWAYISDLMPKQSQKSISQIKEE